MLSILNQAKRIRSNFRETIPGWIGMDIGSGSIKIAQVHKVGNEWELLHSSILPINLQPDENDLIRSSINTLKNSPDTLSLFTGKKIASVLPMSLVEIQLMGLPDGSESDLQSMISQNLQEQNNLNCEKEFVFWKNMLDQNFQDGMTQTTVLSVDRKDVLQVAKYIHKSSYQCETINVAPIALSRALEISGIETQDKPVAVFDWGTQSPLFVIVSDGKPVFTRLFKNCGYSNFINILCNSMGLTPGESEHILQNYQNDNCDDEAGILNQTVSELITAPVKNLSREFGRTLNFIQQQNPELTPGRMVIFGKGASFSHSEKLFQEMTGMESRIWNMQGDFNHNNQENKFLHAELGSAIALSTMAYQK